MASSSKLKLIDSVLARAPESRVDFERSLREAAGRFGDAIPDKTEMRRRYDRLVRERKIARSPLLESLLVRREVRTLSGVAVITVLTKPWPCPGRCVYCPTEARMPKSYLSNEPAAARAVANGFDPYRQTAKRLRALSDNGHPVDKVELIVKGGTWSAYTWEYRRWFIKRCFDACNQFNMNAGRKPQASSRAKAPRTLLGAQKLNEKAASRIIGMTLETRPDWVTPAEIVRLRELGCTRIELGVQSVDDGVLKLIRRGHDCAAVARAGRLLRDAGFKVDYHMMPQLPGSTPRRDYLDVKRLFDSAEFRPDMLKLYPCTVIPSAELHEWWKAGRYRPYSDRKLIETLIRIKSEIIPPYCRISRLIRDIPKQSIAAGNSETNLRQTIQAGMRERGLRCRCLRCREIGHLSEAVKLQAASLKPRMVDRKYQASGGTEHFLSFEDPKRRAVFAFCRLRLPPKEPSPETRELGKAMPEIADAAFIRELHTYGHLVPIDSTSRGASQHTGLGRKLMAEAERLAAEAGFRKMAVISGVGVRGYYRKLGYRLEGTYMTKRLGLNSAPAGL